MEKVRTTPAVPKDLELLTALEAQLFPKSDRFSPRRLLYLIKAPRATVLLCWQNEKCVGYGIALRNKLRNACYKGRIYSVGVVQTSRRKGLGSHVLRALEQRLLEQGVNFITLETRFGANVSFYQKRGYRVVEELPKYYGRASGLRMRKDIVT